MPATKMSLISSELRKSDCQAVEVCGLKTSIIMGYDEAYAFYSDKLATNPQRGNFLFAVHSPGHLHQVEASQP